MSYSVKRIIPIIIEEKINFPLEMEVYGKNQKQNIYKA